MVLLVRTPFERPASPMRVEATAPMIAPMSCLLVSGPDRPSPREPRWWRRRFPSCTSVPTPRCPARSGALWSRASRSARAPPGPRCPVGWPCRAVWQTSPSPRLFFAEVAAQFQNLFSLIRKCGSVNAVMLALPVLDFQQLPDNGIQALDHPPAPLAAFPRGVPFGALIPAEQQIDAQHPDQDGNSRPDGGVVHHATRSNSMCGQS